MDIFEEYPRTICTRGIKFTQDQMNNYRIRRIFNSVGDPEYLNDDSAQMMLENFIGRGEFCLLEATNDGKLYKISLITFEDIWSRNMFALVNLEYYSGFPDLITLYN
jgi:hypothetical protein